VSETNEGAGVAFCGHCGEPADARDHAACARQLVLEPPRFCPRCRRRMKVQVRPRGWSAECAEHGVLTG
jgi:hypothetical protein